MVGVELTDCVNCPLGLEEGPPPSRVVPQDVEKKEVEVVFVGMAPGSNEVAQKKFFVGASGRLIRAAAESVGYFDYAFTNTLLCPISSDLPDPEIDAAAFCCKERLLSQLRDYKPKLVVALGALPLRILTGDNSGILKPQGRIFEEGEFPVLACPHPAAVLRSPAPYDMFRDFREDLEVGVRYLKGTWRQVSLNPKVKIVDNEKTLSELCERVSREPDVVVDLETTRTGFEPYGRIPDGIRCASISMDPNTAYIVPGESSPYYDQHANWMDRPELKKVLNRECVFHNGQFDCGFLWAAGFRTLIGYDTLLAHYMTDERGPKTHGLKLLARKYLGAPEWEAELAEYLPSKETSFDLIPDTVLYKYAAYDAINTYLLKKKFEAEVDSGVYRNLVIPSSNMFVDLRHDGIKIDFDSLAEAHGAMSEELKVRLREIYELTGRYINPSSPQEVARYVYDQLGFPPHRRYGRSTQADILKGLGGPEAINKIIEYREVSKLRSTYLYSLAKHLDLKLRIHPELKLFAAVTGRLAASNPSVLNVVRGPTIKRLYQAPKGKMFLDADQKQMELRWYCIVSGDEYLKELLLTGDPHGMLGTRIAEETGETWPRIQVKAGMFGGVYMRGVESYMEAFHVDKAGGHRLRDTIYTMIPSLVDYHDETLRMIKEDGELTSYFGRKRRYYLLTEDSLHDIWRQGVNFRIQSPASDTNLWCMLHLYKRGKEFGCRPVFPVHDSILFVIDSPECVIPIQTEMERFSEELVGHKMQFTVESKMGDSWGTCQKLCHYCGCILTKENETEVKGVAHCAKCATKLS